MNEHLLDLDRLSLPLAAEQRELLAQEVDWFRAMAGALLFPGVDSSVSDEELLGMVRECRKHAAPGAMDGFAPRTRAVWLDWAKQGQGERPTKEQVLPQTPLTSAQREGRLLEIYQNEAAGGASALGPLGLSDAELIAQTERVRQHR
jgi:hypothetical protein